MGGPSIYELSDPCDVRRNAAGSNEFTSTDPVSAAPRFHEKTLEPTDGIDDCEEAHQIVRYFQTDDYRRLAVRRTIKFVSGSRRLAHLKNSVLAHVLRSL